MSLVRYGKFFSPLLQRSLLAGRLAFKFSLLHKRVKLIFGVEDQRIVEYRWVLSMLKRFVHPNSRVLDVGCAESAFCNELMAMGYEVWGLDINEPLFANRKILKFCKSDVRNVPLPENFFDAIVVISTIEHVGLPVYGQKTIEEDGDIRAMRELRRIIKSEGYLFLTTPFSGGDYRIIETERQYNLERLKVLSNGFEIKAINIYYPFKKGKRIFWREISLNSDEFVPAEKVGVACLMLQKV
ncbi:MAG: class I SAM-dependent methyltransferase [Archaeoglobaceae archaeon]|nr:class I SAM-dependent methyltransferase [Archaeoglobaceae archaeon]